MKIKLRTLLILSVFALFIGGLNNSFGQVSCDGSMTVTPAIGNWGSGTQLGDGSGGDIEICISNNNLLGAGASCGGNSQFVLSTGNGSGIVVIWNQNTANGTCITISTGGSGFAWIALNCELAGATCDITWTTVDGGGASVCGTCSDGILNNGETAIDCGGINCAACPSCSDGILNNGETSIDCGGPSCPPCHCVNGVMDVDETGIDCGGADCFPCASCFDGVQNGAETGVDCGGPTCLPCSTNSSMTPSSQCCSNTPQASVYPTNCDQVGTSAYNLNSPVVELTGQNASGCLPSPSPTGCGAVSGLGDWVQLSLEDGVDYLQMSWAQGAGDGIAAGNSTTYSSLYQGNDCASLSYVSCQPIIDFNSGLYGVYQATWSGLDPNQDVWIYTWNNNNKNFNLDFQFIGVNQQPTNTSCATASTAIGSACNLGAPGATFNTPGSQGQSCTGGNWGSNENTTFYSFTADATTGSLIIDNIICNDGTAGDAQFAVWTSCAAIGTYGADFLGCAVGTGAITLSPLTVGQTYYIAADGFAGDNCTWAFTGTGILLPIKLISFYGNHTGKEVELFWSTATERNNDYFTIQRTLDGKSFEDIGFTPGAGTSTSTIDYSFIDLAPYKGTSYYRIKQTDYDGKFEYSELISLRSDQQGLKLVKTVNLMGQEVNMSYSGMVIDIYDDGSTVKRMKN